jgi:anaerobic magnesium-protoporphyrin IX monomethyl ester cyclase
MIVNNSKDAYAMQILLALPYDPSYRHDSPDLGLGYLAAVAQQEGHDVELLLQPRRFASHADFTTWIQERQFDLIGIKVFSCQIKVTQKMLTLIRQASPKTTIVLGGPQVSADPKRTFELFPEADYGLQAEGERGLRKLLRLLSADTPQPQDLAQVPGLVWRHDVDTAANPPQWIRDLDAIPFPAWEMMPPADFGTPFNGYSRRHPIAPMVLTRGCPHRCTFCGAGVMNGHAIRSRSADNIMEELRMLTSDYGVREIQFYDSNCAHRRGPLREVLQRIITERIDITWCAPNGIRLDSVDRDLARLMKRSGCFQVNVGIESGSRRILRQISKSLSLDIVKDRVWTLREAGIEVVGLFMLGLPGETEAEMRQTISLAMNLPLTGASFSIYCPLPGTADYERLMAEGRLAIDDVDAFDFVTYQNDLSEVPAARLRMLQRQAYLRFHLRPRVLPYLLRNLNSWQKALYVASSAYQKVLD